MVVSWIASRAAFSAKSVAAQYAALGAFVFAEALIFVPLLYIANFYAPGAIEELQPVPRAQAQDPPGVVEAVSGEVGRVHAVDDPAMNGVAPAEPVGIGVGEAARFSG